MSRSPSSAQFVIVGGGAMGSILAARLIASGAEVVLLARGERARQIERFGLVVDGLESHRVPCTVLTDPGRLQKAQFLVLAVKSYDHAAAVRSLLHVQTEWAFSMANGIVKTRDLAQGFGERSVLGCVAEYSGELHQDGDVSYTRDTGTWLGSPFEPGGDGERRAADALRACGLDVSIADDITSIEWSKFAAWAPLMSLAVLTRLTTGRLLREREVARIAVRVIRELAALAASVGIDLRDQQPLPVATLARGSLDDATDTLVDLGRALHASAPDHRVSSLQDLQRGKPLEIEETLGHARRLAMTEGIDTPALDLCYSLVAGIDSAAAGQRQV